MSIGRESEHCEFMPPEEIVLRCWLRSAGNLCQHTVVVGSSRHCLRRVRRKRFFENLRYLGFRLAWQIIERASCPVKSLMTGAASPGSFAPICGGTGSFLELCSARYLP